MLRRASAINNRRWGLPVIAAALAMALTSPSILSGLVADDYYHRVKLVGNSRFEELTPRSLDIFNFFDGDPLRAHAMMDAGITPWWTDSAMRAAFWRPLSALTHWLDYRCWPDHTELMHVHSVIWFGALAALVALMFRRLCPDPRWAALATLLYVIDDAHGTAVGFLANRNAILATVFGVTALLFHDRWRRERRSMFALPATVAFALALLSAEAGIAALAYLVAYAVSLDRAGKSRRIASLVPYFVVLVAWRILWRSLGYGLDGVAIYVDPLLQPLRFLQAVAQRAPIYLLGQWAVPPSDVALLVPISHTWALTFGASILLALMAWLILPVLRNDRVSHFWGLGTFLSVIPICAVFPSDRVLLFVGLGSMALIARFLQLVLSRANRRINSARAATEPDEPGASGIDARKPLDLPVATLRSRPRRTLAVVLIAVHAVLAPIALALRSAGPAGSPAFVRRVTAADVLDASVEGRDLIVVNSPLVFFTHFIPASREAHHQPMPRRLRVLAPAIPSVTLHRTDERTLVVRPAEGFLARIFDRLFRDGGAALHLHDRVELTGLVIEITAMTPDNRPSEAAFRFDVPLEDPSLVWLCWRDGRFQPFAPPPIGAKEELPASVPALW